MSLTARIFTITWLFLFQWSSGNVDSLFIAQVREFTGKQFGYSFKGKQYTRRETRSMPYLCLFVSEATKIKSPLAFGSEYPFVYCKDESDSKDKLQRWRDLGYHAYIYKPYANAACLLTDRLLSYSNEAKCFVVAHELLHNYIEEQDIDIPYDLHEALGDVVGNYISLEYCKANTSMNLQRTKEQVAWNEKIFKCLIKYIGKVNKKGKNAKRFNKQCNKEVKKLLKSANDFQKDRFDYEVNNAYLLKNSNYCLNYFLLKRVLEKQGSVYKLLEIVKMLTADKQRSMAILEKYS
jgi:hypothetical protein